MKNFTRGFPKKFCNKLPENDQVKDVTLEKKLESKNLPNTFNQNAMLKLNVQKIVRSKPHLKK